LFKLDPECWAQEEKVIEEVNELLTKPFSIEELKNAVNSIEKNMAPGPDHIPVEFINQGGMS
jgi:DNA-binding response OmpR family regulator